jgi:hypothetical protein
METVALTRFALTISAAAVLLAGCGGSQSPISAPGAMPQSRAIATHADRRGSWMLPEAKSEDLLYVTTSGHGSFGDGGWVSVFSYPKGTLVGTLQAFSDPNGACVDKAGNVFLTDVNDREIFEYAHGGTRAIRTLADTQEPGGCSVDPRTGNLAVANGDGSVAVYRNGKGDAKTYHDPILIDAYFCAYDADGNLFVDGFNYYHSNHNFQFVELPPGRSRFRNIALNETLVTPTGVQWDGKYIVVGDGWSGNHAVYRVTVTGLQGSVKRKVSLAKALPEGYWIENRRLINPDFFSDQVEFFTYPAGGLATKVITGVEFPSAATVSRAKN